MTSPSTKIQLKKDISRVIRCMDFISENFLRDEKVVKKKLEMYYDIYQSLATAWEFYGLQCKHWDGFKRVRDGKQACRICGKIKGTDDSFYLLPAQGEKTIGKRTVPTNSRKVFPTKKEATITYDSINFHGAELKVDVHNMYKSTLWRGGHEITIAAQRGVTLAERGVEYSVDDHLIKVELKKREKGQKPPYGHFPWELRKKELHHFPVIFEFDDKLNFYGLTIFHGKDKRKSRRPERRLKKA